MIPITKNNYYRPISTPESFTVEIDPINRIPKSYYEELVENAKEIWELKNTGPVYCLYSGGIDSEIMLGIFLSLKMNVIPVVIRLMPEYNSHDLIYVDAFCKKWKIEPLFVDVDINHFITSNEMLDLSERFGPTTYQILSTLKVLLNLNGTVLTGSNEPYYQLKQSKWYYVEKEYLCIWNKIYNDGTLSGTPSFHSWTPETLSAFALDQTILKLCNNELPGKLSSFSSRLEIYGRGFFMEPRPKYTGWEQIEKSEIFQHINMQKVINDKTKVLREYILESDTLLKILGNK